MINIKNVIILAGVFLLFPTILYARSEKIIISGVVKDSIQKSALAYANVVVLSALDSAYLSSAISNQEGCFSIGNLNIQRGILKVSLLGYQTKIIAFASTQKGVSLETISLVPTAASIGTVVVNGYKPVIKLVGDVLVFDVKSAPITSGDFGIDLLRLTPMVFVDPKGELLVQNKLATVLVNGRKLPASQVYSYINNLKAEDIQTIKVQTSNALENDAATDGGTINIITKEAKAGFKLTARSSLSYVERNSYNQNSGLNFNYGASWWQVYGSYYYRSGNDCWHSKDGYAISEYVNIDKTVLRRSGGFSYPRADDFRVGAVADLATNHTVGVELSGRNTFPLQGRSTTQATYYNHLWEVVDVSESQRSSRNRDDLYNASAYYTWKIDTLASQLRVLVDLVSSKSSYPTSIESVYLNNSASSYAEQGATDAKTRNGAFQVDFVKNYRSKLGLQAGAKYALTNRNSSYVVVPNTTSSTAYDTDEGILAFYAAASKSLSAKMSVRLGCRVEMANQSGINSQDNKDERIKSHTNDVFPNVTFSYEIDKNSSLAISYSRSISRMPFLLLSTFTVRNSDYEYSVGNPYLKPVLSDRVELRYRYKNHYLSPYFRYSPDVVTQCWNVKDGLIYQSNENRGVAVYTGVDYGFNGNLYRWWSLNWNTQLYYAYIAKGFARTRHFTAAISASSRFTLSPNSSLDLSASYRSSMIEATKLVKGQSFGSIAYNHQFLKKLLNVGVGITDIFQTQRQYVLINTPDLNYTVYGKQPSRSFSVSISYTFSSKKSITNRSKSGSNDILNRL